DGEQLPSLMHTVGSHHEKPPSLFNFDPAGQSSAFASDGTISANGTRAAASQRSVMVAHANIQSVTLAEGNGASGSIKPLGWLATHREKRLTTADGTGI